MNDKVSIGVFQQVMWERDVALAQLAEIGKGLGAKMDDVRPMVRGQWKRVDPRSTVVTYCCSECDFYAHMDATNFCPNCGADMRDDETAIS